jgi:minor extracellular serine protease Vpr
MRVERRLLISFFCVALLASKKDLKISPAATEALTTNSPSKLEAGLRLAVRDASWRDRIERYAKTGSGGSVAPFAIEQAKDGSILVPVFITTRDLEATNRAITAAHGSVSTVVKNLMVARLPFAAIETIAAGEDVERIEPSYFEKPALDVSRKEIRADLVQAGTGLPAAYTGKGVIVGVLDSGIDWTHADFKDANGKTRIISLWDMTTEGKPPAGTAKGFECKAADIDASNCPERDTNGHGTHVAGIAAGNGRTRNGNTFMGMAPDADLVIVKAGNGTFSQTNIVDGVNYIFRVASALNKPAVVNLSLGGHNGAHDGSSSYEQSLTNMLAPGHLITVANGNEGGDRIHVGYDAVGVSYATGISTYWDVQKDVSSALIDVWYSGSLRAGLVANVKSGSDLVPVFTTGGIVNGNGFDRTRVTAAGTTVGFVTAASEVTSGGSEHLIILVDNNSDSSVDLSQVTWEFFTFGSGHIDAWTPSNGAFSNFQDLGSGYLAGDFDMTVGLPATGSNMIAVGSYTTKVQWIDVDGKGRTYKTPNPLGQISAFSSMGPTRDGRRRPIVSAPGEAIASTLSKDKDITGADVRPFAVNGGSYLIEQGTSQATPHVTGVVALMLQARPTLDVTEAYTVLRGKARRDSFTGSSANNVYGDGKADAVAYVAEVAGSAVQPTVCTVNGTTLCLAGNRFAVSTQWRTVDGQQGSGQAVALSADTGYFTFFSASNVEMVVKVLNACVPALGNKFWVFAGGLTNVQVTMTVIDTKTGSVKTYTNPQSTAFQPIQDTGAFSTCP